MLHRAILLNQTVDSRTIFEDMCMADVEASAPLLRVELRRLGVLFSDV
jgi:hypothetical protein